MQSDKKAIYSLKLEIHGQTSLFLMVIQFILATHSGARNLLLKSSFAKIRL